jgi:hypothetical protein
MIDRFFYNFFSAVDNMFSWLETYSIKFTSWLCNQELNSYIKREKKND